MSRSYAKVRPKAHRVYSVSEVMVLFNICRNTVSNWVRSGLRPSEGTGPQIFRGAELKRFREERKSRNSWQLRVGEFNCLGCSSTVFPDAHSIVFLPTKNGAFSGKSTCPDCNAHVFKFLDETERDSITEACITNTGLAPLHEGKGPDPLVLGKYRRKLTINGMRTMTTSFTNGCYMRVAMTAKQSIHISRLSDILKTFWAANPSIPSRWPMPQPIGLAC